MNIISKYIWLIDTISRAGSSGITFDELDRKYRNADAISGGAAYNLRTFHNHKRYIAEIFGIEICCNTDGYHYYIADGEELGGTSRFRRWLLTSVSVSNLVAQNKKISERILLEEIPSSERHLFTWLNAIQENRMVQFDYTPFWTSEILHYSDFTPLCLKLFKRRWYVVGHPVGDRSKVYSIDRMANVELEEKTFLFENTDCKAESFFFGCYGVYVDNTIPIESVRLKTTDEYSVFCIRVRPAPDLIQELLSYADSVEVLSPRSLRDSMKKAVAQMYKNYKE